MAKFKGKGVVVAGLLAGAATYLSNKKNRDKAMEFAMDFLTKPKDGGMEASSIDGVIMGIGKSKEESNAINRAQSKASNSSDFPDDLDTNISKSASVGKDAYEPETLEEIATTAAKIADHTLEGNQFVEEGGGQTTLDYFNNQQGSSL